MTIWSEKEKEFLIKKCADLTIEELSKIFPNRTKKQIYNKLSHLGLISKKILWTAEEVEMVKKNYSTKTNKELLEMFPNKTRLEISGKAGQFGIRKTVATRLIIYNSWNEDEIKLLKKLYPIKTNHELSEMEEFKNRTYHAIMTMAYKLGLKKTKKTISRTQSNNSWSKGKTKADHPSLARLSRKMSGKNNHMYGKTSTMKTGFRKDLNQFFRSGWEANIARLLKFLDKSYEYESCTFNVTKSNSTYTPDFYIPEEDSFIEVKGYWFKDSKKKFENFKIEYSHIKMVLIDKEVYKELNIILKDIIPGWE